MNSQKHFAQPPRAAIWLVNLFTLADGTEPILGDLIEEFSSIASAEGLVAARRWFWRQSLKTVGTLFVAGFRSAPLSTTAAILAGFLLTRLFRFYQPAMTALLDQFHVYEHSPSAYIFWLGDGILLGHVVLSALIGVIVALVAKGREMTATVTLGLIGSTLTASGFLLMMAKHVHIIAMMVPWSFASPVAIVVGAVIVRTRRFRARFFGA